MRRRYVLAPEAALDLVEIWRYIKKNANVDVADRVEAVIREKFYIWRRSPVEAIGARI